MLKHVGLLVRRPDMARGAFVQRYEHGHVPLINKILGSTFAGYNRSYPQVTDAAFTYNADYDAYTQIWYASEKEHARSIAILSDPAVGAEISADEVHLFYREQLFFFEVNERQSLLSPPSQSDSKIIYISPAACTDARDKRMAAMESQFTDLFAQFGTDGDRSPVTLCRRNYPIPEKIFQHQLYDRHARVPPLVITELWLKSDVHPGPNNTGPIVLTKDGKEVLRLPEEIGLPVRVVEFGDRSSKRD